MSRTPPTEIYLAVRADGIRKIGCSMNSERRIIELSRAFASLYTIEQVWLRPTGDALQIEQTIHHRFLRGRQLKGKIHSEEHYRISREDAVAAVERAIDVWAQARVPYAPPQFYSWPRPAEPDDGLSVKERNARRNGRLLVLAQEAFREVSYRLTAPMPDFRYDPVGVVAPFTGVPRLVARSYAELLKAAR